MAEEEPAKSLLVPTDYFAYSGGKIPLGTQSAMNCVIFILNDPNQRKGVLGHFSPRNTETDKQLNVYIDHCLRKEMGVSDAQRQSIEIIIGGAAGRSNEILAILLASMHRQGLQDIHLYTGLARPTEEALQFGTAINPALSAVYNPFTQSVGTSAAPIYNPPPMPNLEAITRKKPLDGLDLSYLDIPFWKCLFSS
ncbi:MAG: hypothetical protein M3Z24_09740 [Chloroflexota bacterium]|nr:hypothetical protein [Chloroflexota bacterium]